jgi:hypothetical protein
MNLDSFAQLAEIVGGFAVVISLIYVGYQVQINTAEKRAASVQSVTSGNRELALVYVNNEAAGVAWHKVLDGEELTKRQLDLMSDSIYAHLMALEEAFDKHKAGYIDDELLSARVSLTQHKLLLSPQVRQVYEGMKRSGIYTSSFVEWLEGELRKSELYEQPHQTKRWKPAE